MNEMTIYNELVHHHEKFTQTDVEQDRAIALLVHNMVLEDFVVESSWLRRSERHLELGAQRVFHRIPKKNF